MKTFFSTALLLSAQVAAQHVPWKMGKRAVIPVKGRVSFTNSSSIALIVESPTTGQVRTTPSTTPSTRLPSISTSADGVKSISSADDPTTPTRNAERPDPSDTIGPINVSDNGIVSGDSCTSTVTYHGSVYPTVYVTVTETFDVTLSAANATMTETETLITPAQACKSTVIPIAKDGSFTIEQTILSTLSSETTDAISTLSKLTVSGNYSTTGAIAEAPSANPSQNSTEGKPGRPPAAVQPALPEITTKPALTSILISTVVYSDAPYVSTVIVTMKTPVPVVPQSAIEPPPVFQQPKSIQPSEPSPAAPPDEPGNSPGSDSGQMFAGGVNSLVQTTPAAGDLINSIVLSLLLSTPQTTIANVPIAVRPSSVIIGTSIVPIPVAGAEAVVSQGGVEFTVRPGEIAAPATTIAFGTLNNLQGNAISVPPTRVTAAPGVVVEVGGSTAVVAGTTYRIADDFSTIITVSGQRISIGPSGVGLLSTTIAPARATNGAAVISSVDGITFTLSGSIAIISGTRYGIATDSPSITTEINGERISIGPGGIGFPSTTVRPTTSKMTKTSSSTASEPTSTSNESADTNTSNEDADTSTAHGLHFSITAIVTAILGFAILL